MKRSLITATLDIHGDDPEPIGSDFTMTIDPSGFRDRGGIGRSGDESALLNITELAMRLAQTYDVVELRTLLAHVVALHDALG